MNRALRRRRLLVNWLGLVLLALAPMVLLWAWVGVGRTPSSLAMPLFILALVSLFVSLPLFNRYKRALVATGQARDSDTESQAWDRLAHAQQRGLMVAALPAWIGAVGIWVGLEAVPLVLLALGTLTICWVYKLPKQLD